MKKCIVKVGGSVLVPSKPDANYIEGISSTLKDLNKTTVLGVVVGGGSVNQMYVNAGKRLSINQYQLDTIGIEVSRLNARLLANTIGAVPDIPKTIDRATTYLAANVPCVVMGGTIPGHTTNAVAALLAENTGAKLVNCTNVDGIYDKDPRKFKNAKKYSKMKPTQIVALAAELDKRTARSHFIFDLLAARIIERSGIETHVVNGTKFKEVRAAVQGKKHKGTVIKK